MEKVPYIGRFAPSPTGPLHFGSLVAAVGSYLRARRAGGRWLLRIEDLDPPRESPEAAAQILRALERYGMGWDGEVVYQSRRHGAYEAALEHLGEQGAVYACDCSRRTLRASARMGPYGPVYPGTCARRPRPPPGRHALRVRTDDRPVAFVDALQGARRQRLRSEVGDYVVRRADGLHAYQLAVVIDDAWQGITEVVRGADLLDSTARQIHLQRLLALPTPGYLHLPVAVDAAGEKLSKQTGAAPLPERGRAAMLVRALRFLGQDCPRDLARATPARVWEWALEHWSEARLPRRTSAEEAQ